MRKYSLVLNILVVVLLAVAMMGCPTKKPDTDGEPSPEDGEKEVVKIGAILPLTGDAASYGQDAKAGLDLAVHVLNSAAGVSGKKLQVIYEDSKADPREGTNAIRKLIEVDKVQVIVGEMASSVTLAIAPIAEENKVVLISPGSSSPLITYAGDYIFRTDVSDTFEGKAMAESAYNTLSLRKVAIIYINNDYGVGVNAVFKEEFQRLGGIIAGSESFQQEATDFRTQISKVSNASPDGLYIIGYKEIIPLLKQIREMGLQVQILSTALFEDPEIIEKLGTAADGVIYMSRDYDPESKEDNVHAFLTAFEEMYQKKPDFYFAAQAYDAMMILAIVMEKSGYQGANIKDGLYAVEGYNGVSGLMTFDSNGDVIKSMKLRTVRNGLFVDYLL